MNILNAVALLLFSFHNSNDTTDDKLNAIYFQIREQFYVERLLKSQSEKEFFEKLRVIPSGSMIWYHLPMHIPVKSSQSRISSSFGFRYHPFTQQWKLHKGLDLAVPCGSVVVAAGAGTVVNTGYDHYLGNFIKINHGLNWISVYGHLSKVMVSAGEFIFPGTLIALSGTTGRSTGCHLHYGIYFKNMEVDPLPYFALLKNKI